MRTFLADIRYAARLLRRSPGFTLVATAALAIGIGANLTIFGFANALLLKPPAGLSGADRVVRAFTNRFSATPFRNYEVFRDRNQSFEALAAFRPESVNLRIDAGPEQHFGQVVSGNYFPALGVTAVIGRMIEPSDDRPGASPVVVLSDRFWRRRFGGAALKGLTTSINGRLHTIVGIAPPEFTGTMAPLVPEFWLPLAGSIHKDASVQMIGRLRREATIDQAQVELTTLAGQLATTRQDDRLPPMVTVYAARALTPELAVPAGIFSGFLLVVVCLVLLLACVNIANLQLARSADRVREISVRLALGASRRQLLRQLLAESLLLSLLGGTAAAVLALLASGPIIAAVAAIPSPVPLALTFGVDWRLMSLAIGFAVLTTLACGLVPALQSSKPDILPALKESAVVAAPRQSRLRAVFMTAQVAMSALLLVLAALLVRGLMSAHTVDRGFVTDGVLVASVDLGSAGYSAGRGLEFFEQLQTRLEQTPGIAAASIVEMVPLMLSNSADEMAKEATGAATAADTRLVYRNTVSPGHFLTLGIPLVAGRDFDARDRAGALEVVIINETLARRFWSNENPVGKRMRQRTGLESFGPWLEVIGVARDSKYATAGEEAKLFMYQPLAQAYSSSANILVKSQGLSMEALPALRATVAGLDPNLPIFGVMTLDEATSVSFLPVKVAASLTAALGGLALVLGTIGLYGVMSYIVRQRTRELGIRIALGARTASVIHLVTRQGMMWTAIGLALGLGAAFGVARLLAGFLYGIGPADPIAFGGITVLLAVTAFAACYVPARRASRIDPLAALREQ